MFRRFTKRFEFQDKELGKVTYPRDWAGEVSSDVAKAADAAKATLRDKTADKKAATLALADARRSAEDEVAAAQDAVKSASNDIEKNAAEDRLKAARAAVAKLPSD